MVPSNPEFGVQEIGYVLKHAGVSAVICGAENLAVVREATAGIEPAPWFALVDGNEKDAPNFFDLIGQGGDTALPAAGGADDTCLIIYTSGTTGFPKGAMHSQRNFITAGEANISRVWLQPDDRMMVVLPMFHVNALFYSLAGAVAGVLFVHMFQVSTNKWQIDDVLGRYCQAIDRCDAEKLKSVYWPDAHDEHGGLFKGNAWEFADLATQSLKRYLATMHATMNHLITEVDNGKRIQKFIRYGQAGCSGTGSATVGGPMATK